MRRIMSACAPHGALISCVCRVFTALAAASLALAAPPAGAFGVICCNVTIDMPSANWVGYSRQCGASLAVVSQADRDKACVMIAERGPICQEARAHCKECDPSLWSSYQRKEQVAAELRKHAADLRRTATRLVAEQVSDELKDWGLEKLDENAPENFVWEKTVTIIENAAKESRNKLVKAAAEAAETAGKTAGVAGPVIELIEVTYKGTKIAQEWAKYQEEARKADQKAQELHAKAIADLEADLKQAPMCAAESRRKSEEERKLARARELIEEWDNNQVRYFDPIANEVLTERAALQRALKYLETGRMTDGGWRLIPAGGVLAQNRAGERQQALRAAVRELDTAIASLRRLRASMRDYLRAKARIEGELQRAFQEAPRSQKPAAKRPRS
jgi:hypothetical protein